ncbi:MAG: hypothetical protein R2831_07530 [Chitinophagaceae bacterium]
MSNRTIERLLIIAISTTFFFHYLAWGQDQKAYVYEIVQTLFKKGFSQSESFTHPLILMPLLGIIILAIQLFVKLPRAILYIGIGLMSVLVAFILLAGILSLQPKMVLPPIFFIALVIVYIAFGNRKLYN